MGSQCGKESPPKPTLGPKSDGRSTEAFYDPAFNTATSSEQPHIEPQDLGLHPWTATLEAALSFLPHALRGLILYEGGRGIWQDIAYPYGSWMGCVPSFAWENSGSTVPPHHFFPEEHQFISALNQLWDTKPIAGHFKKSQAGCQNGDCRNSLAQPTHPRN